MTTNGTNGSQSPYNRVILKLSGESLGGEGGCGIDPDKADFIAKKVRDVYNVGVQVAVVIGGGNLWREGARDEGK